MKKIRTLLIMCSVLFIFSCHDVRCEYFSDLWLSFEEDCPKTVEDLQERLGPFVDILKNLDEQESRRGAIVEIVTNVWGKSRAADFIENLVRQLDGNMFYSGTDLGEQKEERNKCVFWAILGRISDRYFERIVECKQERYGLPKKKDLKKIKAGLRFVKKMRKFPDVKASISSRSNHFGVKESEKLFVLVKSDLLQKGIFEQLNGEPSKLDLLMATSHYPLGRVIARRNEMLAQSWFPGLRK